MKPPPNEVDSVEYEMGYTANEFAAVLTGSFSAEKSGYQCQTLKQHQWQISHQHSDLICTINASEKPARKLGLFVLPVLQVQFQLQKSEPENQATFFRRFFKYFHKGGG